MDPIRVAGGDAEASFDGTRQVFDAAEKVFLDTKIVDRTNLEEGQSVTGPAALTEAETTTIIPASWKAVCQPDGCIDLISKGKRV